MKPGKKTLILLILCIVWTILIFILCTMPSNSLPKIKIPLIDKAAHFGFFFVQSLLVSLLLRFGTKKRYRQIVILSTLQVFFLGVIIELLQTHYFNRTGDLHDLIADILGGFYGALIFPHVSRLIKKKFKNYT